MRKPGIPALGCCLFLLVAVLPVCFPGLPSVFCLFELPITTSHEKNPFFPAPLKGTQERTGAPVPCSLHGRRAWGAGGVNRPTPARAPRNYMHPGRFPGVRALGRRLRHAWGLCSPCAPRRDHQAGAVTSTTTGTGTAATQLHDVGVSVHHDIVAAKRSAIARDVRLHAARGTDDARRDAAAGIARRLARTVGAVLRGGGGGPRRPLAVVVVVERATARIAFGDGARQPRRDRRTFALAAAAAASKRSAVERARRASVVLQRRERRRDTRGRRGRRRARGRHR